MGDRMDLSVVHHDGCTRGGTCELIKMSFSSQTFDRPSEIGKICFCRNRLCRLRRLRGLPTLSPPFEGARTWTACHASTQSSSSGGILGAAGENDGEPDELSEPTTSSPLEMEEESESEFEDVDHEEESDRGRSRNAFRSEPSSEYMVMDRTGVGWHGGAEEEGGKRKRLRPTQVSRIDRK